jgi:N-methylhydantoinase B
MPASSAGSMTNFTFGGRRPDGSNFAYYFTIPGGAGAGPSGPGTSAIQTHMTNTANTPVEAIESVFPVRVWHFGVRNGSGGQGLHRGGDGVVFEVEFLQDCDVAVVADRRIAGPPGVGGGGAGAPGANTLLMPGAPGQHLPGSFQRRVLTGERLRVETPGGGGWGPAGV